MQKTNISILKKLIRLAVKLLTVYTNDWWLNLFTYLLTIVITKPVQDDGTNVHYFLNTKSSAEVFEINYKIYSIIFKTVSRKTLVNFSSVLSAEKDSCEFLHNDTLLTV